jgi:hypothetical protein
MPDRTAGFAKCFGVIHDTDADTNNLIRVVDESREYYLYSARLLRKLV